MPNGCSKVQKFDVDLLVKLNQGEALIAIKQELEDLLGRDVDLETEEAPPLLSRLFFSHKIACESLLEIHFTAYLETIDA